MATNKESPPIGIDLGTKFSCVGVFRNGKVEIIANEEGNFTTPCCVTFNETEQLIGDAAKQQMAANAANTIFDVKRLIGKNFNDQFVQEDMKQWPFKVISVDGIAKIEIMFKNDVKYLSAVEVTAMILQKMKSMAESYLNATVTNAVISCPADFNDFQRQATIDAGKSAGLIVLAIVDEPTAVAYGMNMSSKSTKKMLVYDLGGSTFKVSILNIRDNQVTLEATDGDTHLGGDDFDDVLMKYLLDHIRLRYGKNLSNDKRALSRLCTACELAKRTLSSKTLTAIEVDALFDTVDYKFKISRNNFESLCSDLFDTTITIVKRLLQDAHLSCKDIDIIVLAGGSTRIVKIQQLLEDLFKGKDIIKVTNPDQFVAYGAAILASKIQANCSIEADVLQLTMSVGITTKHPNGREDEMWTLIKRHTQIPVARTHVFPLIDNQTGVSITVLQGEHPLERDNLQIGNLMFSGIPINPTGTETVTVKFSIDENGILTVTAFSNSNEKARGEITIYSPCERISETRQMIIKQEFYREFDEQITTVYTAEGDFQGYCYKTKDDQTNSVTQMGDEILNFVSD